MIHVKIMITSSKAEYRVLTLRIAVLLSSLSAEENQGISRKSIAITNKTSEILEVHH